jgi:oligopeptidase B
LYGYGFYGLKENVGFDSFKLLLMQLGWVVAVAHVRGGGWLGRSWHAAAMGEKKEVAVGDFLAVAQHLVRGVTSGVRG